MGASRKAGFSLVELMIALSIILILIGLVLPSVYSSRECALKTECANRLKQVAQILNVWADRNERLPSSLEELVEYGYIEDMEYFECPGGNQKLEWEFIAAGCKVNDLKPDDELIRCKGCNLSVHLDTHIEFLR